MATLPLLPGEHEELRLRPAAIGFLSRYAAALGPAVVAGLLWITSHPASGWPSNPHAWDTEKWKVWDHLYGDDQALASYVVFGIVGIALVHYAIRRQMRVFAIASLALAFLVLGAAAGSAARIRNEDGLPLVVAGLSVPALIWVETRRRCTTYIFTNLRLIIRRTMPRTHERGVRHEDLVDLQGKPGFAGVGRIVPVLGKQATMAQASPVRFPGVKPYARVRAFVELLIQRATAGDFLRAEQKLDQRIAEARSALQRT